MNIEAYRKGRVYYIELFDLDSVDPYENPIVLKSCSRDRILKESISYIKRELNEQFDDTRDGSSPHVI